MGLVWTWARFGEEAGDFLGWMITRADGAPRGREVGLVGGMWPKTEVPARFDFNERAQIN